MKVEILVRTPGENELVHTVDLHSPELLDFPELIVDLLARNPSKELIIRQASIPVETSTRMEWTGGF
jgi:hypothetical protein